MRAPGLAQESPARTHIHMLTKVAARYNVCAEASVALPKSSYRAKRAGARRAGRAVNKVDAMSEFESRQKGQEKKFEMEQDFEFKAGARRNRLIGLWAAGLMGLTGEETQAYAQGIVLADFQEAGDDDVLRKLRADLDAKGVKITDHQLRSRMAELLDEARAQIRAGN